MDLTVAIFDPVDGENSTELNDKSPAFRLTNAICEQLELNCTFKLWSSNSYGEFVKSEWTGFLGALKKGIFDASVPLITPTPERLRDFDIAPPYMYANQIVVTGTYGYEFSRFVVLIPFKWEAWCLILSFVLLITILLIGTLIVQKNSFSLVGSSFMYVFTTFYISSLLVMFRKSFRTFHIALSGKTLQLAWGICSIFLTGLYSRGLLSALLKEIPKIPFKNFDSLVDCLEEGKCQTVFIESDAIYAQIIEESKPGSQYYRIKEILKKNEYLKAKNYEKAIEIIKANKKTFLTTWPRASSTLRTLAENDGETTLIELDSSEPLGFAFRKNSKLTSLFADTLHYFSSSGVIAKIYKQHRRLKPKTPKKVFEPPRTKLNAFSIRLESLSSLFYLMLIGCGLGALGFVIEKFTNIFAVE